MNLSLLMLLFYFVKQNIYFILFYFILLAFDSILFLISKTNMLFSGFNAVGSADYNNSFTDIIITRLLLYLLIFLTIFVYILFTINFYSTIDFFNLLFDKDIMEFACNEIQYKKKFNQLELFLLCNINSLIEKILLDDFSINLKYFFDIKEVEIIIPQQYYSTKNSQHFINDLLYYFTTDNWFKCFPLLILYFSFASFLICCLLGFYIGHAGSSIISTFFIFISFLISLILFFYILWISSSNFWYIHLGTWFQVDILEVNYGFIFDPLSIMMSVVVCLISFLVHLYSINYMKLDPNRSRFMGYLSMFTFFMLVLIFSDNFVLFFFGWEGIGLSSYLLIGFWFTRVQANKSALKALLINRIGDFFLLLGIIFIFLLFGSVDFLVVFTLTPFYQQIFLSFFNAKINMIFFISVLLFIAAVGKSAQIFLHTWLPDAMEGPTPVSALIHAATMVTAGIFLILRTSTIFEYASPHISEILGLFGLLTILLSSIAGASQFDIKKIIAYSTCSQLGYMVLICSFSEYAIAFYHLVNHAFFKALLFLAAGSVIHSLANEQDIRRMGGLINVLPITYSSFIIGSLALSGFPFLSGFFSKDPIVLVLYNSTSLENFFIFWIILFSNSLTCFYSFRLIYYVFLSLPSGFEKTYTNIEEDANYYVVVPFLVLSFLSIVSGFLLEDLFIGLGSDLFDVCLNTVPTNTKVDYEFIVPFYIQILSLYISFSSFFFIFFFKFFDNYQFFFLDFCKQKISVIHIIFKWVYRMSREKNYFNSIYNRIIALPFLEKFNLFFKNIDTNLLEIFGPLSINEFFDKISFGLEKSTGHSFSFFLSIFITSLIYIFLVFIII